MIHINFTEPMTPEWREWRSLCEIEQVAHNAKIRSGQRSEVKGHIYKMQKDVYMDPYGPFHGKCAYCESKIYANQHCDIDHFRPKAGLKDDKTGKPIKCQVGGNTQDHPGYYWLAYDWMNLLPSCVLCNQPSSGHSSYPIGKRNYFPVMGTHATRPGDEVNEDPLLIHPVFEDPEDHLEVDKSGIFYAKNGSPKGETCIHILGLNDRHLPDERVTTYKYVFEKMTGLIVKSLYNGDIPKELSDEIKRIDEGFDAFTAVARKAISDRKEDFKQVLARIN